MTERLRDKRILITGAAAGIGLGIARACLHDGANLILADINYEGLQESSAKLSDDASRIQSVMLDVSKPEAIRELVARIGDEHGRIDGVVNNAGITIASDFLEFPDAELDRLWSTNLRSTFCVSREVARLMKASGGGVILNVASSHSVASTPGYEMYAATKAGIKAMTKAMAWSLGPHGIRVNTLSPGLTHTEEVARIVAERPDLGAKFGAMHATGKYSSVAEIGDIAAFLLSDQASAITGAEIIADHGQSALLAAVDDLI